MGIFGNKDTAALRAAREDLTDYGDAKSNNGQTPFADDDPGYQKRNQRVVEAEKTVPWYRR